MNVIIGFVLIVLIGYAGSRLTLFQSRFSLGLRYLFTAGAEFLFVGLLLGPRAADFLTREALNDLSPVISLGLGWIGLIVGLQFDRKILSRIDNSVMGLAALFSGLVFALVFAAMYISVPACFRLMGDLGLIALSELERDAVGLAAFSCLLAWIATVSTYSAVALIQRDAPIRGRTTKLLQLLTDLRAPIAVTGMGLWYAMFHASSVALTTQSLDGMTLAAPPEPVMGALNWVAVSILLGLALGWMLHYLTSERLGENELLLLVAGAVIFSGGLSSYLHLSPLFVNLVMGIALANLPNFALGRITKALMSAEKPFFVIFLILVGALWPPVTPSVLMVAMTYIAVRAFALWLAGWLGRSLIPLGGEPLHPAFGLTMLPFGGLAIAMAVDFHLIRPGFLADFALNVVLLAVLFNQLAGPWVMAAVLRASADTREHGAGKSNPAAEGASA